MPCYAVQAAAKAADFEEDDEERDYKKDAQ
jgi:hypothetical protein